MKRSLWFEVSMLALILVAATVGATLERGANRPAPASSQSASSAQPSASSIR